MDFHLYVDGVFVSQIAIAEVLDGSIIPLPDNFTAFTNLIKDFTTRIGQTIKSSKKLAEMMAGKARLLSDIIEKALTSDETHNENSTLKDQMNAFKEILIHDITPKGFADVYHRPLPMVCLLRDYMTLLYQLSVARKLLSLFQNQTHF